MAVFLGLMGPLAALTAQVARCGSGGWLAPALAAPGMVALAWRWEKAGDMATALEGKRWRWLAILYYIWFLVTAGLTASAAVDGLKRTDYPDLTAWVMAAALGAAAVYLSGKGGEGVLRWGGVMGVGVGALVAGFLALGLWRGEWSGLLSGGTDGAVTGLVPVLGAGCVGVVSGFLPRRGNQKRLMAAWCAAGWGLCAVTFATLGGTVAGQAPLPLLLALQGLGTAGAFQRLEAVGTAAWAISYLGLILLCGVAMERLFDGGKWNRWVLGAAVTLGGGLLNNELVRPMEGSLCGVNLFFGAAVPIWLSFWRKGKGGKH